MTRAPVGFDLDMTLIDSRRAIMAAFAAVAADTGVPIDPAAVDSRLGIKLEDELAFWFPAGQVAPAMRIYREHYLRLAGPLTSALPGAREAMAAVRAAGATWSAGNQNASSSSSLIPSLLSTAAGSIGTPVSAATRANEAMIARRESISVMSRSNPTGARVIVPLSRRRFTSRAAPAAGRPAGP